VRGELALGRGRAAAALADADRAVVQSPVAIAASPESAVWIMLVAEARFLRARAVRALGAAATPAQRDGADEDVTAAYQGLDARRGRPPRRRSPAAVDPGQGRAAAVSAPPANQDHGLTTNFQLTLSSPTPVALLGAS
jgi:hypothetical protein